MYRGVQCKLEADSSWSVPSRASGAGPEILTSPEVWDAAGSPKWHYHEVSLNDFRCTQSSELPLFPGATHQPGAAQSAVTGYSLTVTPKHERYRGAEALKTPAILQEGVVCSSSPDI